MTPNDSLVFVATGDLAAHLARALAEHSRWCRRNGIPVPAELAALLDTLAATSGPERTEFADRAGAAHADPVMVGMDEAARRLGVSPRTVRRMVADGRLAVVPAGRRRLIRLADIRDFGRSA